MPRPCTVCPDVLNECEECNGTGEVDGECECSDCGNRHDTTTACEACDGDGRVRDSCGCCGGSDGSGYHGDGDPCEGDDTPDPDNVRP